MLNCRSQNTVTVTFTSGPYQGHHEVISLQGQEEYQGGDRTPDQVDMLRERSKNFLGLHVIVGGAILGISMAVLGLLIGFTVLFEPLSDYTFLTYGQLNDYLYPGIGLVYLTRYGITSNVKIYQFLVKITRLGLKEFFFFRNF